MADDPGINPRTRHIQAIRFHADDVKIFLAQPVEAEHDIALGSQNLPISREVLDDISSDPDIAPIRYTLEKCLPFLGTKHLSSIK